MKNIDIEQLDRKNIYEVPDDFFQNMQEHVLAATVAAPVIAIDEKPVPRAAKRRRWYYAAAAVVAALGLTFFYSSPDQEAEISPQVAARTALTEAPSAVQITPAVSNAGSSEGKPEGIQRHLTFASDSHPKAVQAPEGTAAPYTNSARTETAVPALNVSALNAEMADEIIKSLSKDDLSELKLADNDVYLDLYY